MHQPSSGKPNPYPHPEETLAEDEDCTILKVARVIEKSIGKAKRTVCNASRAIQFSLVSMVVSPEKVRRVKSPSKETLKLIKHIHAGFDPLSQSVNRWNLEKNREEKEHEERVE